MLSRNKTQIILFLTVAITTLSIWIFNRKASKSGNAKYAAANEQKVDSEPSIKNSVRVTETIQEKKDFVVSEGGPQEMRLKKRHALQARLKECKEFDENLKRTQQENFSKKLNSEISNDIGSWFYEKRSPPAEIEPVSQIDRYLRAFALSGIVKSPEYSNFKQDIPSALRLIDDYIRIDPTNSAGYLLKAFLLDSEGKFNEAEKILTEAEVKTDHFETGSLTITKKIISVSESAADMLVGKDFQSKTVGLTSYIIPMISKYKKIKLGEQIMQPALDDSKLLAEIEWSSMDYQAAKHAVEKLTGKKLPNHLDISQKKHKLLSQQFPEFDPEKIEYPDKDSEDYLPECHDSSNMEKELYLLKKAIVRSK